MIQDYTDLFLHRKNAHVTKYMYDDEEDLFGKLTTENPGYYIISEEMRVIENCSFFIKNIFGDNLISVIEFGPGDKMRYDQKQFLS